MLIMRLELDEDLPLILKPSRLIMNTRSVDDLVLHINQIADHIQFVSRGVLVLVPVSNGSCSTRVGSYDTSVKR